MTQLIEQLKKRLEPTCFVTTIRKQGCSVSLDGTPQDRLIVDFDKFGSQIVRDKRCDYLAVVATSQIKPKKHWVILLELKSGSANVNHAMKQLQASAKVVESFLPPHSPILFRPAIVSRKLRKAQRNELKKTITYRNQSQKVKHIRCGGKLTQLMK